MAFSMSKRRASSEESSSGVERLSLLTARTWAWTEMRWAWPVPGDVEAADDDVVGVEVLSDADGGGAGGAEVGGEAEVIHGEGAVVAREGEEAGGAETLIEGVGEGVADPVERRLAGAVVEGEDKDDVAVFFGGLGKDCRGQREEHCEGGHKARDERLLHGIDYRRTVLPDGRPARAAVTSWRVLGFAWP